MKLLDSGNYDYAYTLLREINDIDTIFASKYDRAIKCMDSGDYESAYILLKDISYKDSKEKCAEIKTKYNQILMRKAAVGDKITFGTYEQDNVTSNGAEDIEWLVLAKENNKILVISDKALDSQPYNEKRQSITWEQCSLRKWLNDSFLNAAFNEEERALIQITAVYDPFNPTKDKIFLFSIYEATKYLRKDQRACAKTIYAQTPRAYLNNSFCCWWLRSSSRDFAAIVDNDGSCDGKECVVIYQDVFVRPALWISIE